MIKHYYLTEVTGEGKYPVTLTKDGKTYIPDIDGYQNNSDVTMEWNSPHPIYHNVDNLCDYRNFYYNTMRNGYKINRKAITMEALKGYLAISQYSPLTRTFANTDADWFRLTINGGEKESLCIINTPHCQPTSYLKLKGIETYYMGDNPTTANTLIISLKDAVTLLNRHKMLPIPYSEEDIKIREKLSTIDSFCLFHQVGEAFNVVKRELDYRLEFYNSFGDTKNAQDTLSKMKKLGELYAKWREKIWVFSISIRYNESFVTIKEKIRNYYTIRRKADDLTNDDNFIYDTVYATFGTYFDEEAQCAAQLIGLEFFNLLSAKFETTLFDKLDTSNYEKA